MKTAHSTQTKYHNFNEFLSVEFAPGLSGKSGTQLMYMYRRTVEKENPVILELGTEKGASTTVFLQACEEQNGKLVSVDLMDCSDVSDSPHWQFIQADSTNVEFILEKAPHLREGIDVLYIDSLHTREHVEKELMGWYPYLNKEAWIFFDDVDSTPYKKGNRKDKFLTEINLDQIYEYVKSFFYANEDSLYLSIIYGSTGLAILYKLSAKNTVPQPARVIYHRRNNIFSGLSDRLTRLKTRIF